MDLDSEVHSHPHKIGHRWIDVVLASSALVLSIASIIISIQNESNMRRLVTANSWPYIRLYHGNQSGDGEAVIHFNVKNAGVGPATLEKLVVTSLERRIRLLRHIRRAGKPDIPPRVEDMTPTYRYALEHRNAEPLRGCRIVACHTNVGIGSCFGPEIAIDRSPHDTPVCGKDRRK